MMTDERYVDCEICDERFRGESAIKSYIRQVRERDICIDCLDVFRARNRPSESEICDGTDSDVTTKQLTQDRR